MKRLAKAHPLQAASPLHASPGMCRRGFPPCRSTLNPAYMQHPRCRSPPGHRSLARVGLVRVRQSGLLPAAGRRVIRRPSRRQRLQRHCSFKTSLLRWGRYACGAAACSPAGRRRVIPWLMQLPLLPYAPSFPPQVGSVRVRRSGLSPADSCCSAAGSSAGQARITRSRSSAFCLRSWSTCGGRQRSFDAEITLLKKNVQLLLEHARITRSRSSAFCLRSWSTCGKETGSGGECQRVNTWCRCIEHSSWVSELCCVS